MMRLFTFALLTCTLLHANNDISEVPDKYVPVTSSFDYTKRVVMIPMRDGVKLNTIILVPKGAKNAPILLSRTPYNVGALTSFNESPHLASILRSGTDSYETPDVILQEGYIRVVQDVRGKFESEGGFVMNRPVRGPLNQSATDDSTDAYDTIDWLVKNVPESNGRVGVTGGSYGGFTSLMALINPHPALKVVVPLAPMVDGWMGDDWFHYGAFRLPNMDYIFNQGMTRKNEAKWYWGDYDVYNTFMRAGSAGNLGKERGLEQQGFWRKILEHPSYDSFWQGQALDKILAQKPLTVPTMLVHGLWDAEDIYGDIAVYKALSAQKPESLYLVIGPWNHCGELEERSQLGPIRFDSDTAVYFRKKILLPFLNHYLKDDKGDLKVAHVNAFETGSNEWRALDTWPKGCKSGCDITKRPLYLDERNGLSFEPHQHKLKYDSYISDPTKPVPYRPRPIRPTGYDENAGYTWPRWLVDDQREASGRTDVLTYTSDVLTAPLKISGQPRVHLLASTSGSDSDWVVKLIDVYPDEVANEPQLGGYQLMIAADIFRGRYRESFEKPKAIKPNKALVYEFDLPTANHVFLPGHRLMIQIQSAWFPLYDRNPQTFVPNIFWAKPEDYKKAEQHIYYGKKGTYIEMPVASSN